MVNAEKHKKLKKLNFIDIYFPGPFESWLQSFFQSSTKDYSYAIYFGGINGAINRKVNNWNPDNETWFEHTNGLRYAESNNEIMEKEVVYTFAGNSERQKQLWEHTKNFLDDVDIDPLFIDAEDYFNDKFDIFKIFDEVKQYDMLFIKNMNLPLQCFFMDYGLQKCIPYIYCFLSEDEVDNAKELAERENIEQDGVYCIGFDCKYKEKGMIGFELYDNLKEWKKEVTAPTRNDPEYRAMKKRVRERDNFTCQCCGYHNTEKVNHGLEVHHIYGYKDHLDYRTEDSNCVTLCKDCHKKYHSIYGKNNVTPFTFAKFIRDYNTYTQNNAQITFDDMMEAK